MEISFTFLSLPSIIPRRRLVSSMLVMIISSTIFIGSLSVIYDINTVSTDFLGEEENVFVIYNPGASTPFTSLIPEILENSIKEIPGVTKTSPEILQPVTALGQPVYARAGNLSKLLAFDERSTLKKVDGTFGLYGSFGIIGGSLSKRLGIKLGDTITIHSIIREVDVSITIVGVLENSLYDDEILISLSVGRYISTASAYQVGHIRVGFDPEITSQEEITRIALRDNQLSLTFLAANETDSFKDLKLVILENDTRTEIISTDLKQSQSFFLSTNYYLIEVRTVSGIVLPTNFSKIIYLDRDISLTIQMQNFIFNKTLKLVNKGYSIPDVLYELDDVYGGNPVTGTLDSNGTVSLLLKEQEYKISFRYLQRNYDFTFQVKDSSTEVFDIQSGFLPLRTLDLRNGSVLTSGSFSLSFGPVNYPFYVMIDGNVTMTKSGSEQNYLLDFDLDEGFHLMRIVNKLTSKNLVNWRFVVNASYDPISEDFLFDHVSFFPGERLTVNITAFKPSTFSVQLNSKDIKVSEEGDLVDFALDEQIGFFILKLKGILFSGEGYEESYRVIVNNSTRQVGWLGPHEVMPVKAGVWYPLWSKEDLRPLNSSWELERTGTGHYIARRIGGITQFVVVGERDNYTIPFTPVDFDSEMVNVTTDNGSTYTLQSLNNTVIATDELTFSFDNLLYQLDMNASRVTPEFRYDLISDQTVELVVTSLITGKSETVVFGINSVSPLDGTLVLGAGTPSVLSGNSYMFWSDQSSFNLTVSWENGTEFYVDHVLTGETREVIFPFGEFSILVKGDDGVSETRWNMSVPFNGNLTEVEVTGELSYQFGYLFSDTAANISLFNDGTDFYGAMTITNNSPGRDARVVSPTFYGGNQFVISTQYSVYTVVDIDYLNGTQTSSLLFGDGVFSSNTENVSVVVRGISTSNQRYIISLNISLQQSTVSYEFIFVNRSRGPLSPLQFVVVQQSASLEVGGTVSDDNPSLSLQLYPTSIALEVTDLLGNPVFFTYDVNEENRTVMIYVSRPEVSFVYINPNYNTTGVYRGLLWYRPAGLFTWMFKDLSEAEGLVLPSGLYEFRLELDDNIAKIEKFVEFSEVINVTFPIIYHNFTVSFYEYPHDSTVQLFAFHKILNESVIVEKISDSPNTWLLRNVPVGYYELHFKGEVVEYLASAVLDKTSTLRFEYVDIVAKGKENFGNSFNRPQVANGRYGVAKNSEYLNSYIRGTLSIINLILATEVILVFIISLVNISIFLSSVTEESIRELKIVKGMGFPDHWVMYAFAKWLIVLAVISALIGQLLASFLIDVFISSSSLVIFGHLFKPEVNQPVIIAGNILFVLLVSFISAYYSYRKKIT